MKKTSIKHILFTNNKIGGVQTYDHVLRGIFNKIGCRYESYSIKSDFWYLLTGTKNDRSIYLCSDYRALIIGWWQKLHGRKVFSIIHSNNNLNGAKKILARCLLKKIPTIAVGNRTKTYLEENGIKVLAQIQPLTIRLFSPMNKFNDRKPSVIFVGRLESEKGVMELISFTKYILAYSSSIPITIVGTGSMHHNLRLQFPDMNEGKGPNLMGALSHEETLKQLEKNSHLIVLSRREAGVSLVIQEAIASGCRVLTTPVGDIQKNYGELLEIIKIENEIITNYSEILRFINMQANSDELNIQRKNFFNFYNINVENSSNFWRDLIDAD